MSDPQLYLSLMLQAGDRIAQLEDERDVFKRTIDKRDKRIAALEAALKKEADYMNKQADWAQVRLLKHGTVDEEPLYDDTYWQGVADRVRFELYRALEEGK